MMCLFKSEPKIIGKVDEVLAVLPHHATTSIPIPFALPSSSFRSMSLAHCMGTFAFHTAVRSEHLSRRSIAGPLLIYTAAARGCATSHTPLGWVACTHAHTHRKWRMPRCHRRSQATWAAQGGGGGDSVGKYQQMHFSLEWDHILWFCRQSEWHYGPIFVEHIGVGAADLGNQFWDAMNRITPGCGLGLSTQPLEVSPQFCIHCWWEASNSPRHPQLFWTCCWSPLRLLASLTYFESCEQRTYKFSHPHHERQGRKKGYGEKAPKHLYFWKTIFAFIATMQMSTC